VKSPKFLDLARKEAKYFTRNRTMPFIMLMYFLLGIVHENLQTAGRRFLEKAGIAKTITEQSLSAARNKLKWEAFEYLHSITVRTAYSGYTETWFGYHILAIDGTKIALPHYPQLEECFGEEKGSPLARGSVLYDVKNDLIISAKIAPLATDERTLAKSHIGELCDLSQCINRPLVIHDRGYASEEYIQFLDSRNISFLFRIKRKFNKIIDDFPKQDEVIYLYGIKLRVLKITLDSGEIETLLTNVFDMPFSEFKGLYYMRWSIETKYDMLKNKLEITNFSGRTENAIRQDFYIHMQYANILAVEVWEAQEEVDKENANKNLKYNYKININSAVGVFRDYLTRILLAKDDDERAELWRKVLALIKAETVPIRLNRDVPRIQNTRDAKEHHNQKSNL